MKKKLLALALIMIVAVGGIFAADVNGDATALLKGYIPSEFQHGFTVNGFKYQSTYEVEGNVFELESGVVELPYGYRVNSTQSFIASVNVGPFKHENDSTYTIDIEHIQIGTGDVVDANGDHSIIEYSGNKEEGVVGTLVEETLTIKVFIPSTEGKNTGNYTSTITISIDSID